MPRTKYEQCAIIRRALREARYQTMSSCLTGLLAMKTTLAPDGVSRLPLLVPQMAVEEREQAARRGPDSKGATISLLGAPCFSAHSWLLPSLLQVPSGSPVRTALRKRSDIRQLPPSYLWEDTLYLF